MKNGAEKPQMAHVNGICAGLVGPKSENIKKALVLLLLFEGSRVPRGSSEKKRPGEPYRLGGGRGRVNPPPRRMVWRFWEVWRVCCLVQTSTRLEARGLGGLELIVLYGTRRGITKAPSIRIRVR